MKNLILSILIVLSGKIYAQTTGYQLIEDNPDALPESFITAEVLGFDGGFDGDLNIYLGGTAFWSITDKLKAEGLLRYNVLGLNGEGSGFHIEAGGFLPLFVKEKKKDVPVILRTKLYAGSTSNGDSFSETKFFNVKGTYKNQTGFRGGLYFKKSAFDAEDESSLTIPTNYTLLGAYAGIELLTQAYVKTKVGDEFKYGAGQTRIYFDALIIPVKTLAEETLGEPEKNSTIGFRAGMQWNKKPHNTKEKGFELHPVYTGEIGTRPISGFYVQISVGLIILSK